MGWGRRHCCAARVYLQLRRTILPQHWGWQRSTDGRATDAAAAGSVSRSERHRGRSDAGRPDSGRVGSGAAAAVAARHLGHCTQRTACNLFVTDNIQAVYNAIIWHMLTRLCRLTCEFLTRVCCLCRCKNQISADN